MSDPKPASASLQAGPELDAELQRHITGLIEALLQADAGDAAAAEAAVAEVGAPALDRLMLGMTDLRGGLERSTRLGTILGRLGDPRFEPPLWLGTLMDVPGGTFVMGGAPLEPEAATNALPQHEVDLPSFAVARYPVTNKAYAVFVADGGYERADLWSDEGQAWRAGGDITVPHYWRSAEKKPNHPVVGVSWFEAQAYCCWLTVRLVASGGLRPGELMRLPTEAEWEKTARGGHYLDRRRARVNPMPQRRFPWGDAFFANLCNTAESGVGGTSPVGMFSGGASPYNADDVAGNVLEWCNSRPGPYPYRADDGRELPHGARQPRVARGGAWPLNGESGRCAYRHWNRPDFRGGMIGFRVVRGHLVV